MIDTYQGMILPLAVNAVNFLLVYNYMLELPRELDEAARVDGAKVWQVLWHITVPLAKPAIYSATLLAFLAPGRTSPSLPADPVEQHVPAGGGGPVCGEHHHGHQTGGPHAGHDPDDSHPAGLRGPHSASSSPGSRRVPSRDSRP